MTTAQEIMRRLQLLPDSAQREVLDFVEFLALRKGRDAGAIERDEDEAWSRFSLESAMRGMEDEETLYTLDDIKESVS